MRTIVVSGASSGIGKATAERFLGSGDYVVNLDVAPPEEADGPGRRWIETDVADWGAVRDALARVHDERGRWMSSWPTPASASGAGCWTSPRRTCGGSSM